MLEDELDLLIGKAICDDITEDEIARLRETLSGSESARLKYVEAIDLYASMFALAGREPDEMQQLPARWGNRKIGGRRARRLGWGLVAAALFALIGFSAAVHIVESQTDEKMETAHSTGRTTATTDHLTPVMAWLSSSYEVEWADGLDQAIAKEFAGWRVGDHIGIHGGLVSVRLESGVQCCLSGECLLTIESKDRIHLTEGKAAFHVPKGAEGFVVTTPSGTIEDLGTTFGVSVGATVAEAQVMQGEIIVTPRIPGIPSIPIQMGANSAIRLDETQRTVSTIPFDRLRYRNALGGNAGVLRMSSSIRFRGVPVSPTFFSELAPSPDAVLLREKTGQELPEDFVCFSPDCKTEVKIPAGTVVDSFLLHFSPELDLRSEFEVEFANDVVGIMRKSNDLDRTDAMFMQYPNSLDTSSFSKPTRGAELQGDAVLIDDTQRIVKMHLACVGQILDAKKTLDQVRILVRSRDQ